MSLPQVGHVLNDWLISTSIKTVTRTTTNFIETNAVVSRTQYCVVQPAQKETLNPRTIDWSLEYLRVHSKIDIEIGEFVELDSKDYKVIEKTNWNRYGYSEVIAEETKRPLLVVT